VARELSLPKQLKRARWKVKIQDKETREPPHVSILRGTDKWRLNLRTGQMMDTSPDPAEIPDELLQILRTATNWRWVIDAWDEMYPDNPVATDED
jgi:hypothetical protein